MAKIYGPLHSDDAQGTIGKELTFAKTRGVNWARTWNLKKDTRTGPQDKVRKWFKSAIENFTGKTSDEIFLWKLALRSQGEFKDQAVEYWSRGARCLFTHNVLKTRSFWWNRSPFPPSFKHIFAEDKITNYSQLVNDVETLTELNFGQSPSAFFFPDLGGDPPESEVGCHTGIMGIEGAYGGAVAFDKSHWEGLYDYEKDQLVAHELTHALISQHGNLSHPVEDEEETIVEEISTRVADNNLEPVYIYNTKTLTELVQDGSLTTFNRYKDKGWIE